MRTIVSLTPLPLDRDSRTLKIATSLARIGYRSVVVENRPSLSASRYEGIDLVTLGRASAGATAPPVQAPGGARGEDFPSRLKAALRPLAGRGLAEPVHLAVFILAYFLWRPVLGLRQVPRADLYYLHEYRLFPTVWLLQLVRGRVPVIYDAHDIYQQVYGDDQLSPFWRRVFLPFLGWMERWCARHADAVVSVGHGVAATIATLLDTPVRVIRNCHDRRLERLPTQTVRDRIGLEDGDRLVVVIGNRKPGQVIEPTIAALAKVPGVHLAFVGRSYDDAAGLAARHNVSGRVHAVGAVPPECVVPFVRSADAAGLLYWPHTANTLNILPNGFFQSVSAGLPLLYPDLPEITGIIAGRPVGRQIDPRDGRSMVDALTWLIQSGDDIRATARETVDAIADEVSWQREEERLAALVAEFLPD
ncbi:MAG: glycosyltransferase [Alphaproteobacteria bacterium]|nr:glycosyltransferase [Alphaproteobacteria bacterium]